MVLMKLNFRSLAFLYLFSFFANLLVGMVLLGLPLFAIHLGAGNIQLGIIGTLGSLAYVLFVPFSGWLSDRIPRNLQAGAGAVLFGALLLVIPFVPTLTWIYPLVALYLIATALIWPALESALCGFSGGVALARSAGWFNVSWSSGATLGFLLAGLLYSRGPGLVFWLAGGLSIVLGLAFSSLFRAAGCKEQQGGQTRSGSVYLLYLSWLSNGMVYFVFNILRNIFPRLAESLGFSSADLGMLLLCLSLAQTVLFVVLNLTSRWHFKFWPIVVALLSTFAGLLIVVFADSLAGFAIGFLLIGASGGVTYSASLYYAVSLESSIAGSRSGWHEFYLGAGAFSGPLIGGLLAHYLGPKSPYAVSAILVVILIFAQVFYFRLIAAGPKIQSSS